MIALWERISMPDHCPSIFAGLDPSFFRCFQEDVVFKTNKPRWQDSNKEDADEVQMW